MTIHSLNNIIKLKEWKKEEIATELRKIQKMIKHHEETIRSLEEEFRKSMEEFQTKAFSNELKPEALRSYHVYIDQMTKRMNTQKESLKKRLEELKETQKMLTEAHRDKRLVERLREKRIRELRKEQMRKEQKTIDDISLKRFGQ